MISYPIMSSKNTISLPDKSEEMYNLLYMSYKLPKDFKYQIIKVSHEYIARPDLLSKHFYGTVDNADIICKLNGISNPFELNENMYLIIPEASDLQFFYNTDSLAGELSTDDSLKDDTGTLNMQKKKNEPRKANEQIVGDGNFRIDKNNKIVIY